MKTDKKNFINSISSPYYLKLLNKFQNQRKNLDSLKTFKVSSSNNTYNKYKSEIPYSIKPLFCSVPKDVNMHKILVNMMNSSFKINGNKSIYVKISQKEIKLRNNILNNLKALLNKKGVSKKIFCAIIFLYDILYIKNLEKKFFSTQEEIGVGALLLGLKFIYGKVKFAIRNIPVLFPSLFTLDEDKNKNDINEIEIKCLKLLDYYLNFASPISFMEIFFINGIIFSTDNIKTTQSGKIYELVIELIEKIMLQSNEYIKYNPLCLCSCIVTFAREMNQLEKWPKILNQAFGVNFSSFDDIYNEFHEFVINNINNNDENKLSMNNINNIYKHKSLVKLENDKSFKYLNNKYNSIDGNNCNENSKSKKSNYQIKNFLSDYKSDKHIRECSNNIDINNYNNDMEIPSLTEKKGFAFKSIFANKINEKDKVSRQILFKSNKDEDYSNVATSENSNNYNKNYYLEKSINNSNISPNEKDEKNNSLYKTSYPSFTSQKKCNKKYERWNSIKKLYKIKNDEAPKESFYPCTEMKTNFSVRNYNNYK